MVPESLLEVTAVAESFALVDLETLKVDLGIGDTSQDARLNRIIASTAQQIAAYIGRPVVEQSYRETYRLVTPGTGYFNNALPRDGVRYLPLQRFPITAIASVVEAGNTLDPSLYSWMDDKGLLRLDANAAPSKWASGNTVVSYTAGWIGAKETITDVQIALPDDFYEAAMLAAKTSFYAKDRDPSMTIRAETMPDVYEVQYDTRTAPDGQAAGGQGSYGLPVPVMGMLDAYRRASFMF